MNQPLPNPSGDLSPPRAPPTVATAAGGRGKPPQGPVWGAPSRRLTWFVVGEVACALLALAAMTYAIRLRPFSAVPASITAFTLSWVYQRKNPDWGAMFARAPVIATLIAGAAGELLSTARAGFQRQGLLWQIVGPILFGTVLGMAIYASAWGAASMLRLAVEMAKLTAPPR